MKARRFGILALLATVAAVTSGALLAQAPQPIGTWASVGEVSTPLTNGAVVALPDNRTLIAGGRLADGTLTDAVTIYDPVDNSATAAGALTSARTDHTATLLKDGRVLVVGGTTADGLVSSDIEIFDPATATSMIVALLPDPRTSHVAAGLPDGSVLITGGATVDGAMLQTAVLFDPGTSGVSSVPGHLHTARLHASATTLLDGRVLVAGGSNGTAELASAEIYDRYTQSFSNAATQMSVGRQGHSAVLLLHNGAVLVAGGRSNGVAQAGVDLFLPAVFPDPFSYGEGEFTSTGEMTVARAGAVAGPTNVEGYAFAAGGGSADAEVYRFATIKTDKDDYAPGELATITGSGWQPNEEVTLLFQEDPAVHDDYVLKVTANSAGNIYWNKWAPERHDLGVRFYLTATGSASRAQTTFTDALKVTVKPNNQNLVVAGGANTSVTFDINNDNNGQDSNNPITVNYVLTPAASLSVSGDPLTGTVTLADSSALATLNFDVTAPAGPASGLTLTLTATIAGCSTANCSDSGKYNFDVTAPTDSTPPVITPTLTGTLGSNGWYRSDVKVTWTVTDPESTITSSPCGETTITSDTTGTVVTCSATSAGGTSTQSVTIKRDATAPSVTATRMPGANANGWNNTDVTVTFAGTDALSGIDTCDTAAQLTTEGSNLSASGNCVDKAGNTGSASVTGIKIDKTAPAISASRLPLANSFGWNNADVTASYTASDALSGLAPGSPANGSFTFNVEGGALSHIFTVTDVAGNSASATVSDVKIDKTAPAVTATPSPAANAAGWNNTDVTVTFAGTDALSDIASCDVATVLSSESNNLSATGSCVDKAGNSDSATISPIKIDKTAPTITAGRTPIANSFGWNNTDVTASYTASDALSGLSSLASGSHLFDAEGAGQSHTFTVTDLAGNSASATISNVNIDKTAPAVTATRAPAANANGWNKTDVTVTFAATDALSGIDSCQDPTVLSTEGAGQSAAGGCTDKAGNSASASAAGINIDKTLPEISASRLPPANAFGWNNTDVTASYTASDALSGLSSLASGSHLFDAEGAGQSHTFTVTDLAGNSASATISNVNIDKTAPAVTATRAPAANANGWNKTDVTVTFAATDALSGIDSCQDPTVLSTEGAGQSAAGNCTDKAGNSASASAAGINIDKTLPEISASRLPVANAFGWNNANVTASYEASDLGSGLDANSPATDSYTFTAELSGQSHTFTVTDLAGNSASATISNVNIDKTAPAVTATRAPAANANGWNKTDVTVTFAATDALSGIDSCQDPTVLSTEGANQSASGSCTDKAGNSASASAAGINIDKTLPEISASRLPPANAFGWNNTDVTASYTASDALSGLSSLPNGTYVFSAEGTGQSHTFTVTDLAGNSASASISNVNIDKTGPTLSAVVAPNPVILNGTATATPTASDALSGVQSQSCPSVNSGSVGAKTLTCSATDYAGNTKSLVANYSVVYAWDGFLQPINDTAHQTSTTQSKFKLGQTVPVKFVLRDAAGLSVQQTVNPNFLMSGNLGSCSSYTTLETTDPLTPDVSPVFKWDGTQYHFNWSTKGLSSGVYRIYAKIADNTQPWVDICLTK